MGGWVTGFAFIFEAAGSWLSRIPDSNLLEWSLQGLGDCPDV